MAKSSRLMILPMATLKYYHLKTLIKIVILIKKICIDITTCKISVISQNRKQIDLIIFRITCIWFSGQNVLLIKQVSKKNMSLLFDKSLEEKKSRKSKLQLLIILFEITPFESCRMTLNLAELVVNFKPKQSAVAL